MVQSRCLALPSSFSALLVPIFASFGFLVHTVSFFREFQGKDNNQWARRTYGQAGIASALVFALLRDSHQALQHPLTLEHLLLQLSAAIHKVAEGPRCVASSKIGPTVHDADETGHGLGNGADPLAHLV
jgi:hypothetical protein